MIFKLGICSCIVMFLAQLCWHYYNSPAIYYYGDGMFKCGILYAISRISKKESFYYYLILDFFFNLAVIDYIYRLFSDYGIAHISQYIFFSICVVILIIRLILYSTKLSFKSFIKKVFNRG